ncbi:ankyrin repeat protein, putative [Trichomonas vaginalis G3]|uniref:Ankyrin repeat protein, putative n=1 Tax=Trichomonas vaginalis (strain ATCC PRA-98 / G3) TaxID=412133 RepID=A2F8E7_TRIV3|nr:positive regulation of myosin-light-chain-phosphatase protein [Trichomonas vaginalis G3]EAX98798.1 ankyrin repeat protein, putative [Trichomonas vaginalis G3]KAI5526387.1 positive regulation of myosin-light-chain-phosphatase protein [Trichomonas vaginalis G3]|eukprot:XP_001311728.1 ankyrin repeat protein [Trichomonas vaginalis G3]
MIEFLISNGANVNQRNSFGNTPLHVAALFSNKENAEILISHGAEINSLNKNGQTPLDIAVIRYRKQNEDFLKNHQEEMKHLQENNQDVLNSLHEESEIEALLKSNGGKTNTDKEFTDDAYELIFEYIYNEPNSYTYIIVAIQFVLIIINLKLKRKKSRITDPCTSAFVRAVIMTINGILIIFFFHLCKRVLEITARTMD